MRQLFVQPCGKGFVENPVGLRFGEHDECGIDARLNGPLAQQLGAEPVNGADVRLFEVVHRLVQTRQLGRVSGVGRARSFQLFAQSELQLTRGLLAEGDGDDLSNSRPLVFDQRNDAADQLGGLARTGRRLDDHRLVEFGGNEAAVLGSRSPRRCSGPAAHGSFLSASRSAKSPGSFRRVRRSSSRPHTT